MRVLDLVLKVLYETNAVPLIGTDVPAVQRVEIRFRVNISQHGPADFRGLQNSIWFAHQGYVVAQVLVEIGKPQEKVQHAFFLQMAFLQAAIGQEMNCGFRLNAQLIQGSGVDGLAVPAANGDSFQVAKSLVKKMVHA